MNRYSDADVADIARAQIPQSGTSVLDHIGIFGPDFATAHAAYTRLGFTLTPENRHSQPGPDGTPVPSGTGNQCVMFEWGYLEILAATGEDTQLARQLKAAQARYPGLHLVAYGVADAETLHAQLADQNFRETDLVHLQRPAQTETGEKTARFSVVRLAPEDSPEGRVQALRHQTPELVWQGRWLGHANGALALTGLLLCVDDPNAVAERFGRFLGCAIERDNGVVDLESARGRTTFVAADGLERLVRGVAVPTTPFMAAMGLAVEDVQATRTYFDRQGVPTVALDDERLLVPPGEALGAALVFHETESDPWA